MIGATGDDDTASASGAVYVYSGSIYGTQTKVKAGSPAASDLFGSSLCCDTAGTTFATGATGDGAADAGVVYVCSGSNYTTQVALEPSDGLSGDLFGQSVACSDDIATVVVGAPLGNGTSVANSGVVFVYTGGSYATETKVSGSDAVGGDRFGYSVACSSDASVIVTGAYLADDPTLGSTTGVVYVFSGTSYGTETKLNASDATAVANYGWSVDCSADGSIIVVGARLGDDTGGTATGVVYIYSGTNWATETKIDGVTGGNQFGFSVSCSLDGYTVAIGAPEFNGTRGTVYLQSGANWATRVSMIQGDPVADDAFGNSVSYNKGTMVIGTPMTDAFTNGKAYVFSAQNTIGTLSDVHTVSNSSVVINTANISNVSSIQFSSAGPTITYGDDTPNTAVTAPIGSLFIRTNGAADTTLYVNTNGATAWTALTST